MIKLGGMECGLEHVIHKNVSLVVGNLKIQIIIKKRMSKKSIRVQGSL